MIKVAVLTVSDSCAQGRREDLSGQTIKEILEKGGSQILEKRIVADDRASIARELMYFSDEAGVDVVLTTGGTGLGPRDVTPEATESVCERVVPGLSEIIRLRGWEKTKNAVLSRATAGIRKSTLIINLPGSPKGVKESLQIVLDILPHAVEMLHGRGH
ncbi:MAG: MogA/MoaB family molybdenum cofactor biosynthesis protein [Planctomycetota bacterium]|jgi:molybdenum cofactor synthesis domain-containing protein